MYLHHLKPKKSHICEAHNWLPRSEQGRSMSLGDKTHVLEKLTSQPNRVATRPANRTSATNEVCPEDASRRRLLDARNANTVYREERTVCGIRALNLTKLGVAEDEAGES